MNKFLTLLVGILLSSCVQQNFSDITILPPEEVLKNAAEVSALLESAAYELESTFSLVDAQGKNIQGSASIDGTLHEAGNRLQFTVAAQGIIEDGANKITNISTNADIVVIGPEELYIRLNTFSQSGESTIIPPVLAEMIQGTWLELGTGNQSSISTISSDPRLLHAQAKVVHVMQELPLAKIDSAVAYHYKVQVDHERLVAYLVTLAKERGEEVDEEQLLQQYALIDATGELWIDAKTYQVQQLQWKLDAIPTSAGGVVSGTIAVQFFDLNAAEPILAPENAQSPQEALLSESLSSGLRDEMQLNTQEDIVRSLLE